MISAGGAVQDPETGQLVIRPVEVLGPQLWKADGKFVLGADTLGRDVAVRVLYGGLNSLKIGIGSALICTLLATILALDRRVLRRLVRLADHARLRPDRRVAR